MIYGGYGGYGGFGLFSRADAEFDVFAQTITTGKITVESETLIDSSGSGGSVLDGDAESRLKLRAFLCAALASRRRTILDQRRVLVTLVVRHLVDADDANSPHTMTMTVAFNAAVQLSRLRRSPSTIQW